MRRVALKGLWLRRGRTAFTALAIVLGVAMVSGTYVLTDTISKAFDDIFTAGASRASAVITGRELVRESASGEATIPGAVLDRVRAVEGVAAAGGAVGGSGTADQIHLVGPDGERLGNVNAPGLGFGFDPGDARFNPLELTAGRWASGDGELVIDRGTAQEAGLEVGDAVGAASRGRVRPFRIVGIARYGRLNSLGGATIAVLDLRTAQAVLGKRGQLDTISVAAAPGVTPERLVRALRPVVPARAAVRTSAEQAQEDSADIREATAFIRTFLLAFAVIALGVGAFVIFNTLSITVAQRIRELATLRTLGASGGQLQRSVLLEAAAVGVLASAAGTGLGLLLARALTAVLKALGVDLPQTGQVLEPRTVAVSLSLGVLVTVLASLSPARRATRIPPVAAMQEGATLPPRLGTRRPAVPAAILVASLAALGTSALASLDAETALACAGVGTLGLFVGVGMVAGRLVRPLARVVGAPARRTGAAGRLAGENATRNPQRTATTAAALMIGLALVTVVATLGQGLRTSDRRALERAVRAEAVVASANGFDPLPASVGRAVADVRGARAYPVRFDRAEAFGDEVSVNGLPPGVTDVLRLRVSGGPAVPRPGQAVVERRYAERHGLRVGSTLRLRTPGGTTLPLVVSALQERTPVERIDPLLGRVLVATATFDQAFPRPHDRYVFVRGGDRRSLRAAVAGFPSVEPFTRAAFIAERVDDIATLLNLLYVLLALSVVVSLLGMVNTLVLSVFERTREIGMLRAIGMSRRQVRRMVRYESLITAAIGAALGLPLGVGLAALLSRALADEGLAFALPIGSLLVFSAVALLAGVLAAIAPARRAARLDVLEALGYE